MALALGCAGDEELELGPRDNPCGLDGPTRIADAIFAGGLELDDSHGVMLARLPSEGARRGVAGSYATVRFELCGPGTTEEIPARLRPAADGGYACGATGLLWTNDFTREPVLFRRDWTSCSNVAMTAHGLWLAEDGKLALYRTPESEPEIVATDIDTDAIAPSPWFDTRGWPLGVHGEHLYYRATGGAVRSVHMDTGVRSLVADGSAAVYGDPLGRFIAWVETIGDHANTTLFFPDRGQAVRIPGAVYDLAGFDDYVVTRDSGRVGFYRPGDNTLRVFSHPELSRPVRIEGRDAYVLTDSHSPDKAGAIHLFDLDDGSSERLAVGLGQSLIARPNPYGSGILVHAESEGQTPGRLVLIDRDRVEEIASDVTGDHVLLGDGSVLYNVYEQDTAAVWHRLRSGEARLVAWNASVLHWPFPEVLRGDALFAIRTEPHVGLWRMPATP